MIINNYHDSYCSNHPVLHGLWLLIVAHLRWGNHQKITISTVNCSQTLREIFHAWSIYGKILGHDQAAKPLNPAAWMPPFTGLIETTRPVSSAERKAFSLGMAVNKNPQCRRNLESFWGRYISRWWFQLFFIFIPTWGNDPIWLIFFKWGETTN